MPIVIGDSRNHLNEQHDFGVVCYWLQELSGLDSDSRNQTIVIQEAVERLLVRQWRRIVGQHILLGHSKGVKQCLETIINVATLRQNFA
jgi:hypothetical protein